MKRFLVILQFMTRIPINKSFDITREDYAKAIVYFPLVGLIVGFIVSLPIYIIKDVYSPFVTSILGVIFYVFVTGAIHLDGFSDTCDGFFSGRSREKILEIMKDSRLGTFGGVGLILVIAIKWALYFEIINNGINKNILEYLSIILTSSIASRSIVIYFAYKRKYARDNEGLGDLFIGKITTNRFYINQILCLILIFIINYKLLISYFITLILMLLVRKSIEDTLKGVTGDILGFSIEISEVIFMFLSLGVMGVWN